MKDGVEMEDMGLLSDVGDCKKDGPAAGVEGDTGSGGSEIGEEAGGGGKIGEVGGGGKIGEGVAEGGRIGGEVDGDSDTLVGKTKAW